MTFHSPVSTTSILFEHVLATVPTSAPAADYVISGFPEYEVDLTSDQRNVLNRIATEIVNSQSGPNPVSALVIT